MSKKNNKKNKQLKQKTGRDSPLSTFTANGPILEKMETKTDLDESSPAPALLEKLWIANITKTIKEKKKVLYLYHAGRIGLCVFIT